MIRRLPSNRYQVIVWTAHATAESLGTYPTKREARAAEREAYTSIRRGTYASRKANPTIRDHLATFLAEWASRGASAGTLRTYREHLPRLLPVIGDIRIQKLTLADCNQLRDTLAKRYAPNTVRGVFGMLVAALNWAIKRDHPLIYVNPAAMVHLPAAPRQTYRVLEVDEARRIVRLCLEWPRPYLGHVIAFTLLTGRRYASEFLGETPLRWAGVDFERHEYTVFSRKVHKPLTFGLSSLMEDVLRAQQGWIRETFGADLADPAFDKRTLVFPSVYKLTEPVAKQTVLKDFHAICEQAGVARLRLHDVRHTLASQLGDVSLADLAWILGHSSPATTAAVYAHGLPQRAQEAVNRWSEQLREAK